MAVRPPWERTARVGQMYRCGLRSASLAGANGIGVNSLGTLSSAVFSVLWNSPTTCMQLTNLELRYSIGTTFTASQDVSFGLYKVSGYTAAPTGGYQATFTSVGSGAATYPTQSFDRQGGNPALSGSGPVGLSSYFATAGDFRICTTGSLTPGTGNIDNYPMYIWDGFESATAVGLAGSANTFPWPIGAAPNTHCLTLQNYDGFVICPLATLGAGGVLNFFVTVEWIEVANAYAHG